jgi:hypothetical protein
MQNPDLAPLCGRLWGSVAGPSAFFLLPSTFAPGFRCRFFEAVVKLDPSADESRALAISSWSELGETNKVAALAKGFKLTGFKLPTARWAEMAAVKVKLETGNVSNATVRFADFTRQNPMMSGLLGEGSHAWRRIDWQLFDKLISSEKR